MGVTHQHQTAVTAIAADHVMLVIAVSGRSLAYPETEEHQEAEQ